MKCNTNLIAGAIKLAGGRKNVAKALGFSAAGIDHWVKTNKMPAEHINQLCALGGNVVDPARILAYIEECASRKNAPASPSDEAESA